MPVNNHPWCRRLSALRMENPGLRGPLVVVGIAPRQQNAAVFQASLGHEVPGIAYLTGSNDELCGLRIINFYLFAASGNQKFSCADLGGNFRKLEAAGIQRRRRGKSSGPGIVNLRTAQRPLPIPIIGSSGEE